MRKWLKGSLCALAIAGLSGCDKEVKKEVKDNKYEINYVERTNGFYLDKKTKEGHYLTLWMDNQKVTVHLGHIWGKRDEISLTYIDFDKNDGIEDMINLSKIETCKKYPDFWDLSCTKEQLKKGNELFQYALKELKFEKYRKKRGKIDNGFFGGW